VKIKTRKEGGSNHRIRERLKSLMMIMTKMLNVRRRKKMMKALRT
jgi:hypothetical protein